MKLLFSLSHHNSFVIYVTKIVYVAPYLKWKSSFHFLKVIWKYE
jgi:hypothetical protein